MKQTLLSGSAFALFLMAVLAVGCTDPIEELVPDGPITLSTSVSFADASKALSNTGAKTFSAGDQIAVIYYNTNGQPIKAVSDALTDNGTDIQNEGKIAKFTVTLPSPMADDAVRYIYPAEMAKETIAPGDAIDDKGTINYDALAIQDGTLEYVSKHLDLCTFDGNITGGTLPTNVSLTNRLALLKIGFKEGEASITAPFYTRTLDDGSNIYTVNGGNTNEMWVAIKPVSASQTLEFCATKKGGQYHRKVTEKTLAAGYFYDLTIKMKELDGILLAGKFTVNKEGGRVYFSKGNLQYKAGGDEISGYPGYYFAENQWDYIGNFAGNTTETDRRYQTARIDLFGWGTGGLWGVSYSSSEVAECHMPWDTSTVSSKYYAYGKQINHLNEGGDKFKYMADWGYWGVYNGGGHTREYWRTLKNYTNTDLDNEWEYIMKSRKTGKTVHGENNARYTMATINTDDTGVNGLILFPDNYAGPTTDIAGSISWGTINSSSDWGTHCTTDGWTTLEAAGCVFLPAAGYRLKITVINAGSYGYYWSSSCKRDEDKAYCVTFGSNGTSYVANGRSCNNRHDGYAVRLVKDVSSLAGTL